MKLHRQLVASLLCAAFAFNSLPADADVPYVNSGSVVMSGGSPYIYLLNLVGQSSCTVASSTGSGTVAVEVSQDGIVWTPLNIVTPSGTSAMTLALPGVGTSAVAAYANARAHLTAGAGGPVYFACGAGVGFGAQASGGSGSVTVTNFPNPQNVNITQVGGNTVTTAVPVSGTGTAGTPSTGIVTIQGINGGHAVPITGSITGDVTVDAGTGWPDPESPGTPNSSLIGVQGNLTAIPVPVQQNSTTGTTQAVDMTGASGCTNIYNTGSRLAFTTIGINIYGTWTGTITPEATVAGTTYVPVNAIVPSTGATVSSITSNGTWRISAAGWSVIRLCPTVTGTGSATVDVFDSGSTNVVSLENPISFSPSGTQNVNQLQLGGATLGAATAIGTTASGNVQGVQGTIGGVPLPVSGSVSVSNFPATQPVSGTVAVTQGTSPWVVTTPPPTTSVAITGTVGVTQSTSPWVVTTPPPFSGVVSGTVTANAGTGFPSVTAAGTSGASLTTVQGSPTGIPIPVSGTFTPSGTQNVQGLGTAGTPSGGVLTTQNQDTSLTGNLAVTTVGNNVQETLGAGQGTVGVSATGASTGATFTFEGSVDGTTFVSVSCVNANTGNVSNTFTSAQVPILFQCNTSGFLKFGTFVTNAGTGGPVTMTYQNTSTGGSVTLSNSLPAGTNSIGTVLSGAPSNADGSAGTANNGADIKGFNGTTWDRIRVTGAGLPISALTPGILGVQGVGSGYPLPVLESPYLYLKTVLTSASPTACTSVEVSAVGEIISLVNSSSSGLLVTLNVYDEGASPTCANADLLYSIQMAASQITTLNMPMTAGIAYSLSSALTAGGNITMVRR
jgi:hypothetical protein